MARFLRKNLVFALLLAAGLALRAVTLLAYRPAIINVDAAGYLDNAAELAPNPIRPIGYPVFLRALWANDGLTQVVAAQHLLGLGVAVLVYAALVRLDVRPWLAAAACAPVLLDAMQLNIEQSILSDTLFAALLACGCAVLVWRRPPGMLACAGAGALFAAAVVTRTAGLLVVLPVLLGAVLLGARRREAGALGVAFALPLAAYAGWFYGTHGVFTLNGYGGQFAYARVAPFADCGSFAVPADERVLCPREPVGQRPTSDEFVWSPELSPLFRVKPDPGDDRPLWAQRSDLARDFAVRVVLNQPGEYASRVASDSLRGFAPTRSTREGEVPADRWKFRTELLPSPRRDRIVAENGGGGASIRPGLASFLHGYQRFGYTPGPVLGGCLLVALAGAVLTARRRTGLAAPTFVFAGVALVVLLVPVATTLFSWRYQLPQLILLPPAAALGATALLAGRRPKDDRARLGSASSLEPSGEPGERSDDDADGSEDQNGGDGGGPDEPPPQSYATPHA